MNKDSPTKMNKLIRRLMDAIAYGVVRHEGELSELDVISALDNIEISFTKEAGGSVDLEIEIKRIVSGYKLKLLSRRNIPFEQGNDLYQNALSLGFSNLMEEGTIGIYFSQYCARLHHFEAAKAVLERMLLKARDVSSGPPRVRRELERDAKRALDQLRQT